MCANDASIEKMTKTWNLPTFNRHTSAGVFLFADSQEEIISYLACVSIACKQNVLVSRSQLQADGQQFLAFVAGFLRACPPVGKVHEVLTCSPDRVDIIISVRASSYHRLLRCWASPSEADILNTFCVSLYFTPSCEKPLVCISGKLGSEFWTFPWQRCNSGGMFG